MREQKSSMSDEGTTFLGSPEVRFGLQPSLIPTRFQTIYAQQPQGKNAAFLCEAAEGGTYYCKHDLNNRPTRATEWFSHGLARALRITVPESRVMENANGHTFFGSRSLISNAGDFEVRDYLSRKQRNELGGASNWLGQYLSRIYVLDMFLNNPDRTVNNFLLGENLTRLCAIDFADSRLEDITSDRFPVATSNTVRHMRLIDTVHGFSLDMALEMIENIQAIPVSVIDGIIRGMPNDWILDYQIRQIHDAWAEGKIKFRLSALRSGLNDGSRR